MQSDTQLSDLVERTLLEIGKLGLCPELNRQYRRIYGRLKAFARGRNVEHGVPDLLRRFLQDTERRYRAGTIGRSRRNHLKRAALLLKDCLESGQIEWKVHGDADPPMPSSEEFRRLHVRYLDNLRTEGKSQNTIDSGRNIIRQFLVFLDDGGCRALRDAPLTMMPAFFQHLLARYRPTSIRVVACHVRSFLKFTKGGERLLPLVPLRCARSKPIIPVLSDQEYAALRRTLDGPEISLRDKAIILLALRTGLRSIDIAGMKLSDIDWVGDTIAVCQSKTRRPFRLPLTADVGNALSAYILTERPQAAASYVFLRSLGPHRPLSGHSACYALVRKAFAHAGIRVGTERKGLHVFRHSVASRMLSRGVSLTTIASVLGHGNKASTGVYLATDEVRMRECGLPLAGLPLDGGGVR
jgi:integrase